MTRATLPGRLLRASIASAVVCSAAASCIDNGSGYIFVAFDDTATTASFVDSEDGLRIRLELETYVDSDGDVLLDSALVVVNGDGQSTSLPDPDIETEGFPVHSSGQPKLALEVQSPITDVTSFDAFCAGNGRSADVTLRFFATTIDPDPSAPPPVTELSTSVPLALTGSPEPPNVFAASDVAAFGGGQAEVKNVVMGPDGSILFVVQGGGIPQSLTAYRADAEERDTIDLLGFEPFPRVASDDPDVLYIAGVDTDSRALRVKRLGGPETPAFVIDRGDTDPQYATFNVVAMQPTSVGVRAAVISSFPLLHPVITDPADGTPPEDKYYGSFIVEAAFVDGVLEATSIVEAEREIVSWVPLSDGMVQISNELPPRSNDATLRIERLDATGAVAWSHDEPVSGYDVDADTLPDGTVLVTYEVASGFVEVLRLSAADGSELSRASFAGTHPTVAPYGLDRALLSFSGRAPQAGVVAPQRAVPLLVELDASLAVVRGSQVACSGRADLQRAEDGSLLLLGAFEQRFTLGEHVTPVSPGALILSKIVEPL